jgi:hypothetical protein
MDPNVERAASVAAPSLVAGITSAALVAFMLNKKWSDALLIGGLTTVAAAGASVATMAAVKRLRDKKMKDATV